MYGLTLKNYYWTQWNLPVARTKEQSGLETDKDKFKTLKIFLQKMLYRK